MLQASLWFSWGFGDRGSSCRCFSCWCSGNRLSSVATTVAALVASIVVAVASIVVAVASIDVAVA